MTDALVALFLLSCVASGLVGSLSLSQRFSTTAETKASALVLAKACVEETGDEFPDRMVRIKNVSYSVKRDVGRVESNDQLELAEIQCAVAWRAGRRALSVELARLEARPL